MWVTFQEAAWKFQSTPPHGRRLESAARFSAGREGFIHASAWEATAMDGS